MLILSYISSILILILVILANIYSIILMLASIKTFWRIKDIKLCKLYTLNSQQADQLVYTCGRLSTQINDRVQSELFPNQCIWFEATIEHGKRYKNGIRWEPIALHTESLDQCYIQDYNQQVSFKLEYFTSFGGTVGSKKQRIKNLSKHKEFYQNYTLDRLNEKFYLGKHWLRLRQEYVEVDSNVYIQGVLNIHDSGALEIVGTEELPLLISTKRITPLNALKSLSLGLFLFTAANIIAYSVVKENIVLFKAFNYTIPY